MSRDIICLDDDNVILRKVKRIFEKNNYNVYCTDSWAKVNEWVYKDKIRLLLCDINMPGVSGEKICSIFKESKIDIQIILFSSCPEEELANLAQKYNADGWLSKLSSANNWLDTVEDVWNKHNLSGR